MFRFVGVSSSAIKRTTITNSNKQRKDANQLTKMDSVHSSYPIYERSGWTRVIKQI